MSNGLSEDKLFILKAVHLQINPSVVYIDWIGNDFIYSIPVNYSKTCVKQPISKRPKIVFEDQLSLNAGQKYCRMLPWEGFCNTFDLH